MESPPNPDPSSMHAADETDEGTTRPSWWFDLLAVVAAGAFVAAWTFLSFWAAVGLLLIVALVTAYRQKGDVSWREILMQGRFQLMANFSAILNPFVLFPSLAYNVGQVVAVARHVGRLPEPSSYPPLTPSLPVQETWHVVNGGISPNTSHSWFLPNQRYAYDLVVEDGNGRSYEQDGTRPEYYFAFGRPILAPADGVVVSVREGVRDYENVQPETGRIDWKTRDFRGNFVIIRHTDELYSFLAHLRHGSITATEGDVVRAGEQIGECGNSGHSTEPHLHVHFQDRKSFYVSAGLPLPFKNVIVNDAKQETAFLSAGDTVEGVHEAVNET